MGKKKEPTILDAVENFKAVTSKVGFRSFIRYNRNMYSINQNKKHVIIVPDEALYLALLDDKDFSMRELDLTSASDRRIQPSFQFVENMDSVGWIEMDAEKLRNNEKITIELSGYPYPLDINIKLFLFRLKKDEFNKFYYRLSLNDKSFAIKKYFEGPVENSGFWMVRGFHVI